MEGITNRIQVVIDTYAKSSFVELEKLIGISNTTIGNYVREKRKVSLDFIVAILRKFPEINPDWLLFGEGEMYRRFNNNQSGNYNMNVNHSNVINEQNVKYHSAIDMIAMKDEIIKTQKEEIEFLRGLLKK